MDKQAVKEIALANGFVLKSQADGKQDLNPYVYEFADELLKRVRLGQQKRYNDLALDLQRVVNTINPDFDPSVSELHRAVRTLEELVKGLTEPQYHKDIPLVGVPKIDSIPHYPIEDFKMNDPINPQHYKTESGVECIDIAELFPYTIGNAIKYAWRAGIKDPATLKQDVQKCEWYIKRARANGDVHTVMNHNTKEWLSAMNKLDKMWVKDFGTDSHATKRYDTVKTILSGDMLSLETVLDDWLTELDK